MGCGVVSGNLPAVATVTTAITSGVVLFTGTITGGCTITASPKHQLDLQILQACEIHRPSNTGILNH